MLRFRAVDLCFEHESENEREKGQALNDSPRRSKERLTEAPLFSRARASRGCEAARGRTPLGSTPRMHVLPSRPLLESSEASGLGRGARYRPLAPCSPRAERTAGWQQQAARVRGAYCHG